MTEGHTKLLLSAGDDALVTNCHSLTVTFCDTAVKRSRNCPPMLRRMNTKSLALLLVLFTAVGAHASEHTLRYGLAGKLQLEMDQEIFVPSRDEAIAERYFSMRFTFGDGGEPGRQLVELARVRASYTAHGMKQRLPASHLNGTTFELTGNERLLTVEGASGDINLGQVTDGGLVPANLLAGLLPALPAEPVSPGSTWLSEQSFDVLVGWSWASTDITYNNEVIDVRESDDGAVVTVRSEGRATLHAAEGRSGFLGEGELERSVEWSINSTTGGLVDYSLEQEASGTSRLPQGQVSLRQLTRVELRGD